MYLNLACTLTLSHAVNVCADAGIKCGMNSPERDFDQESLGSTSA